MIINKMLEKLTDSYNKSPDSNIGKTLRLVAEKLDEIEATYNKIDDWRDVNNAQGFGLDKIGSNVLQTRGSLSDDLYRVLIKTKIKANLSPGDINTIIEVFSSVANVDVTEVYAEERYPAGVYIELPINQLSDALLESPDTVGRFTQRVLAGGVGLEILFEGTFEFASLDNLFFTFSSTDQIEISENEGFSDTDQNIGGAFYYEAVVEGDNGFSSVTQEDGGTLGSYFDSTKEVS